MYLLAYCGLAACLALAGIVLVLYRSSRQGEPQNAALLEMRSEIRTLRSRVEEVESLKATPKHAVAARTSINLTRRANVLRRFSLGESPEEISTTLNLPGNEVKLLLKLHQIMPDSLDGREEYQENVSGGDVGARSPKRKMVPSDQLHSLLSDRHATV